MSSKFLQKNICPLGFSNLGIFCIDDGLHELLPSALCNQKLFTFFRVIVKLFEDGAQEEKGS